MQTVSVYINIRSAKVHRSFQIQSFPPGMWALETDQLSGHINYPPIALIESRSESNGFCQDSKFFGP